MVLAAASNLVPTKGFAALTNNAGTDTRAYPVLGLQRATLPIQRQGVDTTQEPGEATLSPLDLWRRTQDDWGMGAGQSWFDRNEKGDRAGDEPSRSRFVNSINVDPWEIGEISSAAELVSASAIPGVGAKLIVAGARLYLMSGQTLRYTTDLTTWVTVTTPATTITDIATDGYTVWIAYGTAAIIRTTNVTISTSAAWGAAHQADKLGFVKNRLIGTLGTSIFNFTSSTVSINLTPSFVATPGNLTWDAIGEGFTHIMVAGNTGDKSVIYGFTITPEGTDLAAGRVIGRLPDGENIKSLGFYLGFVLIGTTKGVRVAFGGQGEVQPGPLIPTPASVLCFEPQAQFVWFGLAAYDPYDRGLTFYSGLGRLNLADFVASLKPAWAPDVMNTTSANQVNSVVTFLNRQVFVVDDALVFSTHPTTKAAQGEFRTGRITYGVPNRKFFRYVEVTTADIGTGGSIAVGSAVDGAVTYFTSGTITTNGSSIISLSTAAGATPVGGDISLRFTFNRNTDLTSPKLIRWTLRAYPIVTAGEMIELTLDLRERMIGQTLDSEYAIDVGAEWTFLKGLRSNGLPVTLQLGTERVEALVDSVEMVSGSPTDPALELTSDGLAVQGGVKIAMRVFE
ncbi:MAG: hypothetical protein WAT66_14640 [Actinomycetota bacterium]